jgi:type IV secretion system protein VirB9
MLMTHLKHFSILALSASIFSLTALVSTASATNRSTLTAALPGNLDSRVVTFAYTPDVVYGLNVTVGMHTHIVLGPDEDLIELPRLGDKIRWRVEGNEKNLYIKALAPDINTSLSLVTSKRVYQFELKATQKPNERVQKAIFSYPDDEEKIQLRLQAASSAAREEAQSRADAVRSQNLSPNSIEPEDLRFMTVKVSNPAFNGMHAYTDGIRTYIRMPPAVQDLPAVFMVEVNQRGKETRWLIAKTLVTETS